MSCHRVPADAHGRPEQGEIAYCRGAQQHELLEGYLTGRVEPGGSGHDTGAPGDICLHAIQRRQVPSVPFLRQIDSSAVTRQQHACSALAQRL